MIYRRHSVFLFIVAAFSHVNGYLIYLLFTQRRKRATLQLKLAYMLTSIVAFYNSLDYGFGQPK
jgi:hypothetical protein